MERDRRYNMNIIWTLSEFGEFKFSNKSGYLQQVNDEKIWCAKSEITQNKFDSMINPKLSW